MVQGIAQYSQVCFQRVSAREAIFFLRMSAFAAIHWLQVTLLYQTAVIYILGSILTTLRSSRLAVGFGGRQQVSIPRMHNGQSRPLAMRKAKFPRELM